MNGVFSAITPKIELGAIENNLESVICGVMSAKKAGASVVVLGKNPFTGSILECNNFASFKGFSFLDEARKRCISQLSKILGIVCIFCIDERFIVIENGEIFKLEGNTHITKDKKRIIVGDLDLLSNENLGADLIAISVDYPDFMDSREQIEQLINEYSLKFNGVIVLSSNGNGNSSYKYLRACDKIIAYKGKLASKYEKTDILVSDIRDLSVYSLKLSKKIEPSWIPNDVEGVFNIISRGIYYRMKTAKASRLVLGVSGGLDSASALLFAYNTAVKYNLGVENVLAVTMNSIVSSERTATNAINLASELGVSLINIPIDIDYRMNRLLHSNIDVVYENAQSRERSGILLDLANKENGLVLGTSDLTELALGFCTYGGDNIAHYNPNSGLSKLALRKVVDFYANKFGFGLGKIIDDILSTPYSPELKPEQISEQIVGNYKVHEYFLLRLFAYNDSLYDLIQNAKNEFKSEFSESEIESLYNQFATRFLNNRFKGLFSCDGIALTKYDPSLFNFSCDINPKLLKTYQK